jgi:hypothetical protein
MEIIDNGVRHGISTVHRRKKMGACQKLPNTKRQAIRLLRF